MYKFVYDSELWVPIRGHHARDPALDPATCHAPSNGTFDATIKPFPDDSIDPHCWSLEQGR